MEEYKAWVAAKKSDLLWICGQPGHGKTYLSIYLVETLAKSEDIILLEYYCDNKDEKRNTASAVIRGLMFGLLVQLPKLSQCLSTEINEKTNALRDPSFAALWLVFDRMVQISGKSVFCILDGLDECDDTSVDELTTSFRELFSQPISTNSYVKIALTSRPLSTANSTTLNPFPRIVLDNESHTKSDVGIFVKAEFSKYFSPDSLTEYFSDVAQRDAWCYKTKARLVEMANGTFLWAGFAIKELRTTKPPNVGEKLEELPRGLDQLYNRILLQIKNTQPPQSAAQIAALLQWAVVAVRPMSLAEMSAAIPIERGEDFSNDRIMRDLVADCKGLLVITDKTVSLVHQSVKDYLVAQDTGANAAPTLFRVKENLAHKEVARTCISYLQCGSLANGTVVEGGGFRGGPRQIKPARKVSFPLLSYSILNWPAHARLSEQDIFDDKNPFFAKISKPREAWLEANWFLTRFESLPIKFSLLHIAASFNLPVLANRLVKGRWPLFNLFSVDSKDDHSRTPLSWAAGSGHETMVNLLLEKGADVDSKDTLWGKTPLLWATNNGHKAVVKLLLENGASVDSKCKDVSERGWTPLWLAMRNKDEAVMKLLLKNGADVNSKDSRWGQTPLSWAAENGHEALVKLLLENGAYVDSKTNQGHTPLFWAAEGRHGAVVKLLLENGADVDSYFKLNRGPTLLLWAAGSGNEALVKLLLKKGADVDSKSEHGRTPLWYAAENGHKAVVELLLEKGADRGGLRR